MTETELNIQNLLKQGFSIRNTQNVLMGVSIGMLLASLALNWALLTGELVIPNVQYLATDFVTTIDSANSK